MDTKHCDRCGIEITDESYYSIKFEYKSNGMDMSLSKSLRKSNRERKNTDICKECREKIRADKGF